ncbi:YckD family protein [Bacillus sp. z60-18]|uniref:YckD family protein n=1 Tax=unclassified Bacillus (in: firmicutes) TaxID=185979 RepID=UPI00240A207D|nr:YckD family protein [Bacillus sp. HSf4]WFA06084.1 YckD family protein [Bacillus sp. HSf4]
MKKLSLCLVLIVPMAFAAGIPSVHGKTQEYQDLTEEQKNELSTLQKDIMEKKKQLIDRYVEYGMMDEKKGSDIKKHMEQRYEKEKKEGFMPKWGHHQKKFHHRIHY